MAYGPCLDGIFVSSKSGSNNWYEILTDTPALTSYTRFIALAARTIATVWLEIGFPKPSPFPSKDKLSISGWRYLEFGKFGWGTLTHYARHENVAAHAMSLGFFYDDIVGFDRLSPSLAKASD